jgi:hypothetical protein
VSEFDPVTGLGGEGNARRRNSLYAAWTNGVYALVRAAASEWIGRASCTAIALGLFDEGQPFPEGFDARPGAALGRSVEPVAALVVEMLRAPISGYSGTIVEFAGGMTDYGPLEHLGLDVRAGRP